MPDFQTRTVPLTLGNGTQSEAVELCAPGLKAVVVPAVGGELSSLRVAWQGQDVETVWRALDYSPSKSTNWTGRAPLLWPQPGRCRAPGEDVRTLPDGKQMCSWVCEGKRYDMPGHGFVRGQAWQREGHGADATSAWATVAITDTELSRRYYPFAFRLACTYRLDARGLRLRYKVANREARRVMPFGGGNHITFHLPLTAAGRFEDCVIYSPTDKQMEVAPDAFLTGRTIDKDLSRGAKLSDPTLCDTMFGCYETDEPVVEMWDPASFGMRVRQRASGEAKLAREALRYVFWAEPEHRYFCPEPWIGVPDLLNSRASAVELPPGRTFVWEMDFEPILTADALSFTPPR